MSSKYTEAFDSLNSDDVTKRVRAERILSSQNAETHQIVAQGSTASVAKARAFSGKRGIALITAMAVLVGVIAVSIPIGLLFNNRGLLGAMSKLKDTFVDMNGVKAFGVWNAPDSSTASTDSTYSAASARPRISSVSYLVTGDQSENESNGEQTGGNDGVISGDWSDDERYDWESDYDWDPTKANVLIAIDEDGKISEVVYERTNGRGQVRQDVLGNAAAVYVSNGFTYVMYVDDSEWEFWKEINFAQEMRSFSGFHCHHESMQTIVIHNETGKVFALKDLIPQVNELSGATNYTMQVHTFKDDLLYVRPMYGNLIPQWYNVIYDDQLEKIRYELMLPADSDAVKSYSLFNYVSAALRDKYGQQYLLEGRDSTRLTAGIVNLPSYKIYGNSLVLSTANGVMLGTDGRMYAFDGGKLKVFGENFVLQTVEAGLEVAFEGIADVFIDGRVGSGTNGIAYKLKDGYLYSMFGEVWEIDDEGNLHALERLKGSFPRFADDGYLMGGEIIAFVDTSLEEYGYTINGRMVQIDFDNTDGTPNATITHIIDASELSVNSYRMVIEQNENPYTLYRGATKYFYITVQDGKPIVEHFGNGHDGGIYTLTSPITEPLDIS